MRNVMPNYTKLFSTIVTSTIWQEPDRTRIVWITMLALSDKNGEIHASIPGLARIAGVPTADCETAINAFLSPDSYSRTPEHEGRRIAKIDGGWELLNFQKYRLLASTADTLAKNATRQKRFRDRNGKVTDSNASVTPSNGDVTPNTLKAEAEADTEAKEEAEPKAKEETKEAAQPPAAHIDENEMPDLETFCEYFSPNMACLGHPVPLDDWLMETYSYYATTVWPKTPCRNWKKMFGKLVAQYRARHAMISAKTTPMRNGKPQKPINDF